MGVKLAVLDTGEPGLGGGQRPATWIAVPAARSRSAPAAIGRSRLTLNCAVA